MVTLDDSIDPLTGSLTAGDVYEFYAAESLSSPTDPSSSGNIAIAFASSSAVPLPGAGPAALLLIAMAGILRLVRRGATLCVSTRQS